MLIILTLYLVLLWLIFSKLKLVRWGWASGSVAVLIGAFILSVFMAMFNYLTPSGSFVVISRVIEVTPNVSGQVTEIPVQTNVPVKSGTILFKIEPTPFKYKVDQLEASLAGARQQALQLKANYQQASANVEGLTKQLAYNAQRLADIQRLASQAVQSLFHEQDTQVQYETVSAQLLAAKAAQQSAKLAMDSEIGGVNTTVAQIQAQLDQAKWELEQTVIRAPGDGFVTAMALSIGDRATQARAVMSFIVADQVTIVGMFRRTDSGPSSPARQSSSFSTMIQAASTKRRSPESPQGVGQGQIAVSGTLARAGSIGGAKTYPAVISIPKDIDRSHLKLGMPGSATVFAEDAGVIGLIMSILVWVSSYAAYL